MARTYALKPGPASLPKIDYAAELNPQQLAAVQAPPGPALVIAGAGSGKTRTLTYRVAYLLENGIRPQSILLLTFTNKAAREMLERVNDLVPMDLKGLWGGTFHSIGNRILRSHADQLGYGRNFTIMDREDQTDLIETVLKEAGIDKKQKNFPKPGLLAEIFGLATNLQEDLAQVIQERFRYFGEEVEILGRIRTRYEERKRETNCMDFDDLLEKALALLQQDPEVARRYQERFQFILVDEYQDTSRIQAGFIDLLAAHHRNLTVVGDDAQSIYSWRGADCQNILEFPKRYPEAAIHKVEINYRSVPEILDVANAAIEANLAQFQKTLRADRGPGQLRPALVPCPDSRSQAQFVVQRINDLHGEGIDLREIAILYRAHYQSMEIQMELSRRGIPFRISSGLRFYEQAHVKDVAAFMKIAVNPMDEVAFRRAVRCLAGIGDRTAERLWEESVRRRREAGSEFRFKEHLLDLKVPPKVKASWEQLVYTLDELLVEAQPVSPSEMIRSIMEGVYDEYMQSKFANYESRREDVNQLMIFARNFEQADEFLSQMSLLGNVDMAGNKPDAGEEAGEALNLSTVHQAKGLEWGVVFLVWLTEGKFPGHRSLDDPPALEEERRLFYVGLTRARDQLYLTYPQLQLQGGYQDAWQSPSRFLEDIPEEMVEEWELEGDLL